MKFSYKLLKKIDPKIGDKKKLVEKLEAGLFEVDGVEGDMIDISILPNRFSDAGSHWGIAVELAALSGRKLKWPSFEFEKKGTDQLKIEIKENKLCSRYVGVVMEIDKNGQSSKFIQGVLTDCGMKPISAVVDIMNYVMLVTGQPMHAFDANKIDGGKIIVKKAKSGEKFITLDKQEFELTSDMLVIADSKDALAIAGIKGGDKAEVTSGTKKIILEAANFDQVSIFKTVRALGLVTDAGLRFAHNLSPELVGLGMSQAIGMIKKELGGRVIGSEEVYSGRPQLRTILFDKERYKGVIGTEISEKEVKDIFDNLSFKIKKQVRNKFEIEVPIIRNDIEGEHDLIEELARMQGIDKLESVIPLLPVLPLQENEIVVWQKKIRDILTGLGLDEVYNYSFVGECKEGECPELLNPISEEKKWLRPSLLGNLRQNIKNNRRFMDEVRIFELGRVFSLKGGEVTEKDSLGLVMSEKKESSFLELKGIIETLLRKMWLSDLEMRDKGKELEIIVGGELVGILRERKGIAEAELDLEKLVELSVGERGYEEIIKYPIITRDISLLVDNKVRVGEILKEIQGVDWQEIKDVDLVDFYEDKKLGDNLKSLTFRIILQSDKKSLTDKEADVIIKKIVNKLENKFGVEVR